MRILTLIIPLLFQSCLSWTSGKTTHHPDGTLATSSYLVIDIGRDLQGGSFGAHGSSVVGQNESTSMKTVTTGLVTYGLGALAADVQNAKTAADVAKVKSADSVAKHSISAAETVDTAAISADVTKAIAQ